MLSANKRRKEFERNFIRFGDGAACEGECPDAISEMRGYLDNAIKTVSPCPSTEHGRRLNNFCLGSDPEFVFVPHGGRKKARAFDIGLRPGLAAGCDQNMRLAELKGWPTPSAVQHVAGLMASLRWMYRSCPDTLAYDWRAGAHFDGDGIGGHVHFGRKRPHRELEVQALDGLATILRNGRFFDVEGWEKRNVGAGDHLNQRYGMLGDIRPQAHGYEYRTLPSWLCSPSKAFVVLTASKLCVLDPEMTIPWKDRTVQTVEEGIELLQRLARYYCGRDDDAWILKHLLSRPEFLAHAATWYTPCPDFKGNWGLRLELGVLPTKQPTAILPSVIKPHLTEVAEIEEHLTSFVPLQYREVEPTFKNTLPGRGYIWLMQTVNAGLQFAGAGDLIHNLVGSDKSAVQLQFGNGMILSSDLTDTWTPAESKKVRDAFPGLMVRSDIRRMIHIDRHSMGVGGIGKLRNFLLKQNLFPLWTVDDVGADSYEQFMATRKRTSSTSLKSNPLERNL